jgi:hypothetical protein
MAKTKSETKTPKTGQVTGRQSVVTTSGAFGSAFGGQGPLPASFKTYREMRKHPTIALARALSIAPILAANWTVEADKGVDEEVTDFIFEQFVPGRRGFLATALFGGCDFGHQGYEKVFEADGGYVCLKKLKPLLQDITEILIEDNGGFAGFKQKDVEVPLENCLLIPFRVEGTDWYGQPLLENCRASWEKWRKADDGAERYDAKVAGAHWIVHYPVGRTRDLTGAEQDNDLIARNILASLESSGSVALPTDINAFVNAADQEGRAWKIELIGDNGARQPTFINRLDYLDKLMVRGLLLPERAVIEGTYGTKAEAETHADAALAHADMEHQDVTQLVNWHAVDQLLALNWGEDMRGTVRLVAGPVVDAKAVFLRQVYTAVLANPSGFLEEIGNVDMAAVREVLGVPSDTEGESPEGAVGVDYGLGLLPIPGVETSGPQATTVRQVYAGPGELPSTAQAASSGDVQDTALNGAQIASIVDICSKVHTGELSGESAKELIGIAFPLIDAARVVRLVDSLVKAA